MNPAQRAASHQTETDFEPYIGLRPFRENESDRFFGRDREVSILLDKIRANKLTLLLAGSGVGKSSLLRAGIMPVLSRDDDAELVYHRDWTTNPGDALRQSISKHFSAEYSLSEFKEQFAGRSLKNILRACTLFSNGRQIVFLDQFEEFFNYQRFRPEFRPFIEELSAVILDSKLPVSLVFSMREDFALELNSFKEFLPGVLDNYFRLEKLTSEQAQLAIAEPLKETGYCFAPKKDDQEALLDQVLDDLARREQEKQFGVQALLELKELPLLVEPPHLQIVCRELWQRHRDEASKEISHDAYTKAGRTEGILETYFLRKIKGFGEKQQRIASAAFDHLIGQSSTKIAHPLERLAELTRADAKALQPVLDRLQNNAILRRQKRGEELWYELYHDIFSESIDKWNREFKTRQRMKRFACWVGGVLIAGGLLFVGNNLQANHYGRYLSSKEGIFDRIEVHRGRGTGWDIFNQKNFRYESAFLRQELEADKRFTHSRVISKKNTQENLVGRLPLLERLPGYAKNGLYRKIYKDNSDQENKLVESILETNKPDLINLLSARLVAVRTAKSVNLLLEIAQKKKNTKAVIALSQLGNSSKLVKLLEDQDTDMQLAAAKVLGELGDSSVASKLVLLLEDQDTDVQLAAAKALGKLDDSSVASKHVLLLGNADTDVQLAAVKVLGELGDSSVASKLVLLLGNADKDVRAATAEALGKLGDRSVATELVKLLKDTNQDENIRQAAAEALGKLGDSSGLIKLLEDTTTSSYLRWQAVYVLRDLGGSSVAPALVKLLEDTDINVRRRVPDSLGKLGDSSVAPALIKLLEDKDANVRQLAAQTLGQLGNRSAVSNLKKLLNDTNTKDKVQQAVVESLGQLGDKSVTNKLVELLNDTNTKDDVRQAAAKALGNLGDNSVANELVKLLENKDKDVRQSTATALGQLGDNSDVSILRTLLEDKDTNVRRAAAEALGQLGDNSGVPTLVKLLKDSDTNVREGAAEALGQLGDNSGVPTLIKLLADSQWYARRAAADALGKLGDRSVAPALVPLLADDDTDVRRAAAEALGRLKAEGTEAILSRYLKNMELRDTVAKALVSMNISSPELRTWQEQQFKTAMAQPNRKQYVAATLGSVFTAESVTNLSKLLAYDNQNVVKAAIESIGNIGEYHPGLVEAQADQLIKLTEHNNTELRTRAIIALGQLIAFRDKAMPPTDLPNWEEKIHSTLHNILSDDQKKFVLRLASLDALGATGREAKEIYELLTKLVEGEDDLLRSRCILWLGRMEYTDAQGYVQDELKKLEDAKKNWREKRDSKEANNEFDTDRKDKTWPKEHWEYLLGSSLAHMAPEKSDIEKLLGHPLYRVRQGAIRALASRIADGTDGADLIVKIIQAHQDFNPKKLPSPFPYAAFRAIDLALWNLEYTGTKNDLITLQKILETGLEDNIPDQEGAIKERLEWTIERLEEKLKKPAELTVAQ